MSGEGERVNFWLSVGLVKTATPHPPIPPIDMIAKERLVQQRLAQSQPTLRFIGWAYDYFKFFFGLPFYPHQRLSGTPILTPQISHMRQAIVIPKATVIPRNCLYNGVWLASAGPRNMFIKR